MKSISVDSEASFCEKTTSEYQGRFYLGSHLAEVYVIPAWDFQVDCAEPRQPAKVRGDVQSSLGYITICSNCGGKRVDHGET